MCVWKQAAHAQAAVMRPTQPDSAAVMQPSCATPLTCTSLVPSGTLKASGRSGMVGAPVSLSFHSYSPSSVPSSFRLASLEPTSSGRKRTSKGVVTPGGSTGAGGTRLTCKGAEG